MPKSRPKPLFFLALAAVFLGAGRVRQRNVRPVSTAHRDIRVVIRAAPTWAASRAC